MSPPELREQVVEACALLELPLVTQGPDHWRVDLPGHPPRPALVLHLHAEAEGQILALRSAPSVSFHRALRSDLLEAVNHWHLVQRWPRLYVSNDFDHQRVEADAHLVVADETDPEVIALVVASFLSGCVDFWEVFHVPVDGRSCLEGIVRIVDRGVDG